MSFTKVAGKCPALHVLVKIIGVLRLRTWVRKRTQMLRSG